MGSGRYSSSVDPASPTPTSSSSDYSSSLKRKRRTADEIKRHFECTSPRCTKSYGSESALKMHLKLKHEKKSSSSLSSSSTSSSSTSSRQPQKVQRSSTSQSSASSISPSTSPTSSSTTSRSPSVSVSPSPSVSPSTSPLPTIPQINNNNNPISGLLSLPLLSSFSFAPQLSSVLSSLATPTLSSTFSVSPSSSDSSASLSSPPTLPSLNLPLLKLRMGLWERQSVCFGDLIARISSSDRCFYWESVNLEGIVRTSVPFDVITSLKVEENHIHITASQPPSFSLGRVQLEPVGSEKEGEGGLPRSAREEGTGEERDKGNQTPPGKCQGTLATSWKSMPEFLLLIGGNCLSHTLTVSRGSLSFPALIELISKDHHLRRAFVPFTPPSSSPPSSASSSLISSSSSSFTSLLSIPRALVPTLFSTSPASSSTSASLTSPSSSATPQSTTFPAAFPIR